jgi:putative colanic acid biosynthesis acetyltransferase WcaF
MAFRCLSFGGFITPHQADYEETPQFTQAICLGHQPPEALLQASLRLFSRERILGNPSFDRGRSLLTECLWLLCSALLFSSWLPGSFWRRALLRLFGAEIGKGVIVKPFVKVKFPWRLHIGDFGGLGERVWIDNVAMVEIGPNSWLSQDVYVCSGNHDWTSLDLPLMTRAVTVEPNVWVGARAVVGPGVRIGRGSVVTLGTVVLGEIPPWSIVSPGPMVQRGERRLKEDASPDVNSAQLV